MPTSQALAVAALACPLAPQVLESKGLQARWRVIDGPITVSQHFALSIQVCPANAILKRVDAQMPAHRHGMNYRVSLTPLGGGQWRAEGLMFHMPGLWELRLDVSLDGRTERLTDTIGLP